MDNMGNNWMANVIAVDPINVYCICPLCGKVHVHGSNGKLEGWDAANRWGSRVCHCAGHYTGEYDLVGTAYTIRSETPIKLKRSTLLKRYRETTGFDKYSSGGV